MNTKWEYKAIDLLNVQDVQKRQDAFNELGKFGWELIAVTPTTGWTGNGIMSHSAAYFKRQIK